jgi:hypothetical protein
MNPLLIYKCYDGAYDWGGDGGSVAGIEFAGEEADVVCAVGGDVWDAADGLGVVVSVW